ncbi:hypothetical protein HA402_005673 [Bradysia odoriphaga]|nr:hypothetical protein HA402_005673 [Bradysia odoriphaga]
MSGSRLFIERLSLPTSRSSWMSIFIGTNFIQFSFMLWDKCDPGPKGIACVPPIQCPALRLEEEKRPQMCDLPGESHGYCCTSGHNHTISVGPGQIRVRNHDEKLNVKQIKKGQPEDFHQKVFRSVQKCVCSINADKSSIHQEETWTYSSILLKRIPIEEFELNQVEAYLDDTSFQQNMCAELVVCPPSPPRYRTENGQCNNYHPLRTACGSADVDRQHPEINLLFMQLGQFITDDVTQSASTTTADGSAINCCTEDGSSVVPPPFLHYSCMPIEIEPHDEFYSQFNQRCINFVRSSLAPYNQCKLGYEKQISEVSHYLDGSAIY